MTHHANIQLQDLHELESDLLSLSIVSTLSPTTSLTTPLDSPLQQCEDAEYVLSPATTTTTIDEDYSSSNNIMRVPVDKNNSVSDLNMFTERDTDGDMHLHISIIFKHVDTARFLIRKAAEAAATGCTTAAYFINSTNNLQQTPLHLAVMTDQPDMIALLLNAGAFLLCTDKNGNTPLHIACARGQLEAVRVLVNKPSSGHLLYNSTAVETATGMRNYEGYTCAHLAVMEGHSEVARVLITDTNMDLNVCDI